MLSALNWTNVSLSLAVSSHRHRRSPGYFVGNPGLWTFVDEHSRKKESTWSRSLGRGNTSKVGAIEWGHNPKRARAPQLYYLSRVDFIVIIAQMKKGTFLSKKGTFTLCTKSRWTTSPQWPPPGSVAPEWNTAIYLNKVSGRKLLPYMQ